MGEITAAVFLAFAVVGPFVCWYLLDRRARALPMQVRARAEGVGGDADENVD